MIQHPSVYPKHIQPPPVMWCYLNGQQSGKESLLDGSTLLLSETSISTCSRSQVAALLNRLLLGCYLSAKMFDFVAHPEQGGPDITSHHIGHVHDALRLRLRRRRRPSQSVIRLTSHPRPQNIRPHNWYLVVSHCNASNTPPKHMRIEVSLPLSLARPRRIQT